MIKILTSDQIREWDQYTIKHEPIHSFDLMERASHSFVERFLKICPEKKRVRVFCGVGNNGGDGLAIGRLLKDRGWEVLKYIVGNPQKGTEDFKKNLEQSDLYAIVKREADFPEIAEDDIVIDGMFGSGLSRPLEGVHRAITDYINQSKAEVISIDIASGLYADQPLKPDQVAIQPKHTISFQIPKLPFLLPESYPYVGSWHLENIGLHHEFVSHVQPDFVLTTLEDVRHLIPERAKFTHKTAVGKLLIVAGSKGKMGAAVLCTRAAMASGSGLINTCTPSCGTTILQISVPEAMVIEDPQEAWITKIPKTNDAVVLGPGMGMEPATLKAFESFLKKLDHPIVIDADGLNLLAKKKSLASLVPKQSILTPHPGEFRRMVGPWKNDFEKLEKLKAFCRKFKLNVVLKGAYSAVCDCDGIVFFNSTGNPALATAGSGDVLAGVIGSFLSQGLGPFEALRLGVFVHGMAGDLAAESKGYPVISASEIIENLSLAMKRILDSQPLD